MNGGREIGWEEDSCKLLFNFFKNLEQIQMLTFVKSEQYYLFPLDTIYFRYYIIKFFKGFVNLASVRNCTSSKQDVKNPDLKRKSVRS